VCGAQHLQKEASFFPSICQIHIPNTSGRLICVDHVSPTILEANDPERRTPDFFQPFPSRIQPMKSLAIPRRSIMANALYGLFNPIPFGCFVAALIFDILYARTAVMLWDKGAAWLITFGLLFAVVPRLVNLVQVWITSRQTATRVDRLDFWLNLFAIVAAFFNALVHTRDAYAVVPAGVWLSLVTVALIAVAHVIVAARASDIREFVHE
jgi:uncharacterized membrane protein